VSSHCWQRGQPQPRPGRHLSSSILPPLPTDQPRAAHPLLQPASGRSSQRLDQPASALAYPNASPVFQLRLARLAFQSSRLRCPKPALPSHAISLQTASHTNASIHPSVSTGGVGTTQSAAVTA
jgi:hypothetical protein